MTFEHKLPTHFRFRDAQDFDGVVVILDKFDVIRETKQGYWVIDKNYRYLLINEKRAKKLKKLRWIVKDSHSKHCHPSLEEAMKSYEFRKISHITRLKFALEQSTLALESMDFIKSKTVEDFAERGINIGKTTSHDDLNWED